MVLGGPRPTLGLDEPAEFDYRSAAPGPLPQRPAPLICEICKQHQASVHITELTEPPTSSPVGTGQYSRRDVCVGCAQQLNLLHVPVTTSPTFDIFKMIKKVQNTTREQSGLTCPSCGMTLAEFRSKGRLGCPQDYEVFREHLDPLLVRMHNAAAHFRSRPGAAPGRGRAAEADHRPQGPARECHPRGGVRGRRPAAGRAEEPRDRGGGLGDLTPGCSPAANSWRRTSPPPRQHPSR